MIRYRTDWLLPIAGPPIQDGWVAVERGRIVDVGGPARRDGAAIAADVDLGRVAVLPGLINAHTHLELSYLRGEVPPAGDFVTWIRGVVAARRQRPDASSAEILNSVDEAIAHALAAGTAAVGDISNTLVTFEPLASSPLGAVVFYELIRFAGADAAAIAGDAVRALERLEPTDLVRRGLAAHAPYSVAPDLFRAIKSAGSMDPDVPCSVHLGESPEEVEFLQTAGGAWRTFLEDMNSWDPSWVAPRMSPARFLDHCGFLDRRTIAVHGVQLTATDLELMAAKGATLVTCPRSNVHTGVGAPPIARFYSSGVRVAVGTDSLASAPDLNVFAELAAMRVLAPAVPAAALLDSATRQGAAALGLGAEFGTIEPARRARLIAVEIPAGIADVEEYLVSGIQPAQVRWIENC